MTNTFFRFAVVLTLLGAGCGSGSDDPPASTGGAGGGARGGSSGSGGSASGGSGGSSSGGSGGSSSGGSGGSASGGAGGSSAGGSGGARDGGGDTRGSGGSGGAKGDAGGGDGVSASAPGQGPVAMGKLVYSQDFEKDMVGINRGMRALPPDRAAIGDDPTGQRGKVLKVTFQQGDNFRTSAGTEPRSWVSNRPNGYEFAPGKKVSHAFGIMPAQSNMNYCFAQVISTGGPVWMLIGNGTGNLVVFCNACGDANTTHFQLEPNKWHDFRVDMDFRAGGSVKFFHNGTMFRQSTLSNTRGNSGHWDGGIYNRREGTNGPTRTVYISNLSVGETE